MTLQREEISLLADVLADIGHELRPHNCGRWDVKRCKNCDDRKPIPYWLRRLVYKRDHFRCVWCGWHENLQLDHITPWSAKGSDDIDNLRTLCRKCNSYRSNRGYSMDLAVRELPHGWACVECEPARTLGNPLAEAIFCGSCEHHALGLPTKYGRGHTAYHRGYATLDELAELWAEVSG